MSIQELINTEDPEEGFSKLMDDIHINGPVLPGMLESLSYYKKFHEELFLENEDKVITILGLYYKQLNSNDLYSFIMSGIGRQNNEEFGSFLTPVQASVRRAIDYNRLVSISAPTSAGKSYSIRDFIAESEGDAVIVVPSRALIAEFVDVMKEKFHGNKAVIVSAFVDDVFKSRDLRHVFVLTPERTKDLFHTENNFDIRVFFFDEAQISEEADRGVIFDSAVRRVEKFYPEAKIIFAHPFVENPSAQFSKHGFEGGFSKSYAQATVGKIFIQQHSGNKKYYYFSPFEERGHILGRCVEHDGDFKDFAFNGVNSVLIYVSKSSVYNGKYIEEFTSYINSLPNVESEDALEIIATIEELIGADNNTHISQMVSLLKKGVVIHHGSIPLEVRFLVESLVRNRHAKICFATSTLAQGINMPFDIVWLHNMRIMGGDNKARALSFKNLIGRAGRLTNEPKFDYGFVFTKSAKLLSERVNEKYELKETSVIEEYADQPDGDYYEFVDSIRNDTFDYEVELPMSKIDRLKNPAIYSICIQIIELIFSSLDLKDVFRGESNVQNRINLHDWLKEIYETSLGRSLLVGEASVFDVAIKIFTLIIQGWSFKEIVGFRYNEISKNKYNVAKFTQEATALPDSKLITPYPLFKNVLGKDVSYDVVVYDTYDYLDLVLSFSLMDAFIGAFRLYEIQTGDTRSGKIIKLLKYGTSDDSLVLLIRYGFPAENIHEILEYISYISEDNIVFKEEINQAPKYIQDMVGWYLP